MSSMQVVEILAIHKAKYAALKELADTISL